MELPQRINVKKVRKPNLSLAVESEKKVLNDRTSSNDSAHVLERRPETTTGQRVKLALAGDDKQFGNSIFQANRSLRSDSLKSTPKSHQPQPLIEGPEPSQDLSYKWVLKVREVALLEQGIPLADYER